MLAAIPLSGLLAALLVDISRRSRRYLHGRGAAAYRGFPAAVRLPADSATAIVTACPGVDQAMAWEIIRQARLLHTNPFYLANLINYETDGTFSPSVRNPRSGAVGLLQFTQTGARAAGSTQEALAKMSALQQMRHVGIYLAPYRGKVGTKQGLYMAVFYPVAMSWPVDREFPAAVQRINPGIRTVADYVTLVDRRSPWRT